MEALDARSEVHGPLEREDRERGREAGAEVYDGWSGEGAACAVGEDEHGWVGWVGGVVDLCVDGVFEEGGGDGKGFDVGGLGW